MNHQGPVYSHPLAHCLRTLFVLAVALGLVACAGVPRHKVHHSLLEDAERKPINSLVLLSVDITVSELSAGGVLEEVGNWSQKEEENIRSAVLFTKDDGIEAKSVSTAALSEAEREILEQHLRLFNVVASNAIWATNAGPNESAWAFKNQHFDYEIGEGLSFLKSKYDVDAGLIIMGEDWVSTPGRKAMFVAAAILGVGLQMGHSTLIAGVVDFQSGHVLWLNSLSDAGQFNMRDPESAKAFVMRLLEDYPGVEAYKN